MGYNSTGDPKSRKHRSSARIDLDLEPAFLDAPATSPAHRFFPARSRQATETHFMWITQHIAARTFVWLAAVAIPLQGLPAVACGCDSVVTCSHEIETTPNCCSTVKAEAGCCSTDKTSGCCCSKGDSKAAGNSCCPCGDNCRCGENNVPAEPTAPPVENSSPERIVADSLAATSFATVYQLSATRRHSNVSAGADVLTALDRCATLCRFTI